MHCWRDAFGNIPEGCVFMHAPPPPIPPPDHPPDSYDENGWTHQQCAGQINVLQESGGAQTAWVLREANSAALRVNRCQVDLQLEPRLWVSHGSDVHHRNGAHGYLCLLYTSPSPRDGLLSRMPSSA